MHIYEACPEVENESVLLYIPHINDRLAHWRGIEFPVIANPTFGSLRASAPDCLTNHTLRQLGTVSYSFSEKITSENRK